MRLRTDLAEIWRAEVVEPGRRERFAVLVGFLVTFSIVRLITHAIKGHWVSFLHNVQTSGGLHIHHFVWGILLVLVAGYLAIDFDGDRLRPWLALLFGIGAALTLDEFALWLNLKDVYWERQGRESVDVVLLAGSLLTLLWVGGGLWAEVARLFARRVKEKRAKLS